MSNRDELKKFINENVIFRANPEKQYNENYIGGAVPNNIGVHHGRPWQVFMRRLTHNIDMMDIVGDIMYEEFMKPYADHYHYGTPFQMVGLETGSLSIITHLQWTLKISAVLDVNAFTVRKERKSYGLFNYVEGIPTKDKIVLIDDFVNTGNALRFLNHVIKTELDEPEVVGAWCILKTDRPETADVKSIFTLDEFDLEYDPDIYWEPV